MQNYMIKYPYTVTISLLGIIDIISLIMFKNLINWFHFLTVLAFNTIYGVVQIADLENNGNCAAWFFPRGSSYFQDKGIKFWGNVIIEDVLFVPVCTILFYIFMVVTYDIQDVLRNKYIISYGMAIMMLYVAYLYSFGGLAARNLINAYMAMPLLVLIILGFDFKSINVTHAIINLIFVTAVSSVWEMFNVWRRHWIYDKKCNLFLARGWFFKKRLHISIFCLYPIGGWIVMMSVFYFFK